MSYIEALEYVEEVRSGAKAFDVGQMQTIVELLYDACNKYRSLYEDAEKRIMRYRDIAGRPDIYCTMMNKDYFQDLQSAKAEYNRVGNEGQDFEHWMFSKVESSNG